MNVANGKYRATVLSHSLAEVGDKMTPSVKVTFGVKHNVESPDVDCRFTAWADLWLSDACFDRTMHTLTKTFGWKGSNLSDLNDNQTMLAGVECILVIENETYKGKTVPKVKFVNDIQKRLDSAKAQGIAERMAAKVAEYKIKSPSVGEPVKRESAAPEATDDDSSLPF
jgi:hypothetical protein